MVHLKELCKLLYSLSQLSIS